jgi:hypothetical protein
MNRGIENKKTDQNKKRFKRSQFHNHARGLSSRSRSASTD